MAEATKTPEEIKAEKAAKFKELGVKRTKNAIKAIDLIGNLSGSNYVSTPEQHATIIKALRTAVDTVEAKLSGKPVADAGITL